MPRAKKAPLEERVPAALEELGQATSAQMLQHLGVKAGDTAGRNQVFRLLWGLVEAGRAVVVPENLAAGFFWVPAKPRREGLQAKTRRAVGLRQRKYGGFTRSDLMALTMAKDPDYTTKLLRFWRHLGLVLPTEETRNGEPVFLLAPGVAAEQLPHWNWRAVVARRRSAGGDACATTGARDQGPVVQAVPLMIAALSKGVQETMQIFASGMRAAVAAHHEEVEKMLQEMEADVGRIAGPYDHEAVLTPLVIAPPRNQGKTFVSGQPIYLGPGEKKESEDGPKSGD